MKWDLTFFYTGVEDPQIERDIQEVLSQAKAFEKKYKELLAGSLTVELIDDMFKEQEAIEEYGARVAQFSGLLFAENTQNIAAQKLAGRVETVMADVEQCFSFINPALLNHSDEELQRIKDESPTYAWVIERVKERKTHTLSTETEQVLAAKSATGRDNLGSLYSKVTSAYLFEMEIDGETKRLNNSQMRNLRYSPEPNLRRKAMKTLLQGYENDKTVITGLYNNIAKDYDIESRIRNYKTPISMRNMSNETEDAIVKQLIETTVSNTNLVSKYYSWKGKKMGLDLELADIYAPLEQVKREYSFEEAKEIVIDTYYQFNERAGEIVESFFNEKRIHSDVLPGKDGGAFCSYYIPNGKPFVLLNHNNSINDVLTMAHELGHGLHGTLSAKQSMLNYHTPLPMAEV
ncbi:MAG: M3 family metallopeptidase, partial [Thermotogota bacterium]